MRLIYWYWGLTFRSNCFETFKYSKNGDFSIILIFLSYSVNHIQWYLVFSNFTDTITAASLMLNFFILIEMFWDSNFQMQIPFLNISSQLLIFFLLIIFFQILWVLNTLLFFSLARVILIICDYISVFRFWWRSSARFSERVFMYFCELLNMLRLMYPCFDRSFVPFLKNSYYLATMWDVVCLIILFLGI